MVEIDSGYLSDNPAHLMVQLNRNGWIENILNHNKTYVSLQLRVQNAVSAQPCVWKIPNISGSTKLFAL